MFTRKDRIVYVGVPCQREHLTFEMVYLGFLVGLFIGAWYTARRLAE